MNRSTAAVLAASLLTAVAVFQTALAFGAPFGDAVLGGRISTDEGVLPPGYRLAAAVQALLLLGMAAVLLARAGVVPSSRSAGRFLVVAAWAVAGFMALNTLGNLASDHPVERRVLGSVTLIVAALATVVARAPRSRASVGEVTRGRGADSLPR